MKNKFKIQNGVLEKYTGGQNDSMRSAITTTASLINDAASRINSISSSHEIPINKAINLQAELVNLRNQINNQFAVVDKAITANVTTDCNDPCIK